MMLVSDNKLLIFKFLCSLANLKKTRIIMESIIIFKLCNKLLKNYCRIN